MAISQAQIDELKTQLEENLLKMKGQPVNSDFFDQIQAIAASTLKQFTVQNNIQDSELMINHDPDKLRQGILELYLTPALTELLVELKRDNQG